jgi:ectoine hydroxylase-related dioxygenase (phytanoyl-CoA dioxygenase family)
MNKHPLNPITDQHIADYERDGVVCLRQMFDSDWIESLQKAAAEVVARPEDFGSKGPSHGAMTSVAHLWQRPGAFRDFALNSPVGEVVGRVIGADTVQMFHDHLFHKPPKSPQIMKWHADHVWPFTGSMIPNIWVALTPVTAQNGRIEFAAGFHHYCRETGFRFGPAGDGTHKFPDFEAGRNDPDYPFRFVTWDLEPGDAVLFHVDTPHYSKGNDSETMARSGLAVRVIGNDSYWCPREGLMPVPGVDLASVPEGVHPEPSPYLPLIWSREQSERPAGMESHAA